MNNQKGFTLVEGLLIVLILAVVGLGGYYVWNQQKNDDTKQIATTQQQAQEQQNNAETIDSVEHNISKYDDWIKYSNEEVGSTFYHPNDWAQPSMNSTKIIEGVYYFDYRIKEDYCQNDDCKLGIRAYSKDFEPSGHGGQPLLFNGQGYKVIDGNYFEYYKDDKNLEQYEPINSYDNFEMLENGALVWQSKCSYIEDCFNWVHFEASYNLMNNETFNGIGMLRTIYEPVDNETLSSKFNEFKQIISSFSSL